MQSFGRGPESPWGKGSRRSGAEGRGDNEAEMRLGMDLEAERGAFVSSAWVPCRPAPEK